MQRELGLVLRETAGEAWRATEEEDGDRPRHTVPDVDTHINPTRVPHKHSHTGTHAASLPPC